MMWQRMYDAKMNMARDNHTDNHRAKRSMPGHSEPEDTTGFREGRERNVETLVVVDSKMDAYYTSIDMDVKLFVLTVLNMVSGLLTGRV